MIGKLEPKELDLLDLLDLPQSFALFFELENFFFLQMVYMAMGQYLYIPFLGG